MRSNLKLHLACLLLVSCHVSCRTDESQKSGTKYGGARTASSVKNASNRELANPPFHVASPETSGTPPHLSDIADDLVHEESVRRQLEVDNLDENLGPLIDEVPVAHTTEQLKQHFASLPPGRQRTKAVHKMLGEAANAMDTDQLYRIYEALPLGNDRTVAGSKYADFMAKRHGLNRALEGIAAFETHEEKIESLVSLMASDEFLSQRSESTRKLVNDIKTTLPQNYHLLVETLLGE